MANDFLNEILGSVLGGNAGGSQGLPGGLGDVLGRLGNTSSSGGLGGLGDVLGGVLGGGSQSANDADGSPFGGKGALLAMLLPLAMQWVQRNGGIGAVLGRFQQQGQGQQVASWIGTGDNEPVSAEAVTDVVGMDELSRLSQQLGVSEGEVAGGLAQILPEVVNHLSPSGDVPPDADDVLGSGLEALNRMLGSRS